jgi:hypothetical protein
LFRLMRMLCAHQIFKSSRSGIYSLTRYSKVLIEGPGSVKYLLLTHLSKLHSDLFSELHYTLKTGTNAAQKMFNKDIFTHIQDTPDQKNTFIKGMSDTSDLFAPVLLSAYKFSSYRHIIDIGGGDGSLLCNILSKYSKLKATLFDSQHVIDRAVANINSYNLSDRIELKGGNFFIEVPQGGDLYILKNILHDWDNKACKFILTNIFKVMTSRSKLVIIDTIINNDNKYSYGKMLDILMLIGTQNGKERTLDEFKNLIDISGFEISRVIPTVSPFSVIECVKQK